MTHEDMIGRTFGRLTVLAITPGKYIRALCVCECHRQSAPLAIDLIRGRARSCGCFRKDAARARATIYPAEESLHRAYFKAYQLGARNREIEFDLSFARFVELIRTVCHYCGTIDATRTLGQRTLKNCNGVDRVNSAAGYCDGNVLPCCQICNRAKGDLSYADFLAYLDRFRKGE